MDRVIHTVLFTGNAVEEAEPEVNPRFRQLCALLDDICRCTVLVNVLQCPVIAAFRAQRDRNR